MLLTWSGKEHTFAVNSNKINSTNEQISCNSVQGISDGPLTFFFLSYGLSQNVLLIAGRMSVQKFQLYVIID